MSGTVSSSQSWNQARYNLTHNSSGTKTYDTVAESLVPGLKSDSDGIVKIELGTSFWDYAEAVKSLSDDASIKHMDTNKLISKINEAQKNPFDDVSKIKAGCQLDLSEFIHAKPPAKEKPPADCSPPADTSCPETPVYQDDQQGGNVYVNYYETNNFFFVGGQQQQPCGYNQPPMQPGGYQSQPGYAQQPSFRLNVTNNMFLMV